MHIECACGNKKCRKVVGIRRAYLGNIDIEIYNRDSMLESSLLTINKKQTRKLIWYLIRKHLF